MLDWLAHAAVSRPDGIALIYGDRRWRYDRLNERVANLAGRLVLAGVGAGDHVAVLMPNCVEYVCIIHALARLGAVLVPLNVRLTADELRWQTHQADCAFLLCSRATETQAAALQERERDAALRILSVDRARQSGVEALEDVPAQTAGLLSENRVATTSVDPGAARATTTNRSLAGSNFRPGRRLDLEAVQGVVFTSGTTGRPKGAMLTYRNHLVSATASAFRLGTLPDDRWLVCMPLYHVGGLAIILRCCLYGTTVVLQERFDPVAVNRALDAEEITLVSLVPTMLHRVLEARGRQPFPVNLRCVLLGGAAAPPALLQRSLTLGVPVATTYGLTETASQTATASPADVRRKAGSPSAGSGHYVGKPLMFSQVRIVAADGGERPAGKIGEIVVRGPAVMKGYYRLTMAGERPTTSREVDGSYLDSSQPAFSGPQTTGDAGPDGWFHTGDMGYLDQDGDLWVVQRRSDLIVTGGENVYPVEVERVILEHPSVEDVCVVGVPDTEWGQRVAAGVVVAAQATLTEDELVAFCSERLAGYKRPRMVRLVHSLPTTPSGKVLRGAVAALFSSEER